MVKTLNAIYFEMIAEINAYEETILLPLPAKAISVIVAVKEDYQAGLSRNAKLIHSSMIRVPAVTFFELTPVKVGIIGLTRQIVGKAQLRTCKLQRRVEASCPHDNPIPIIRNVKAASKMPSVISAIASRLPKGKGVSWHQTKKRVDLKTGQGMQRCSQKQEGNKFNH